MKLKLVLIGVSILLLSNYSCFNNTQKKSSENQCKDSSIKIKQGLRYQDINWERTIVLPTTGKFVEESHYVTTQDKFIGLDFPPNVEDSILIHLKNSLEIYRSFDSLATLKNIYKNKWNKEWTPSEGGECGQGSIGKQQLLILTPETELWLLTMMWTKGEKPEPGTKFILTANEKSIVVVAGFETGPASEEFIGGITCEVHRWLNTNSHSIIKITYPKNQNIPVGPITCKK